MSLKAKIEAVIYAAEEPVTLAQLVGLLGEEAQAELDRAEAAQASLPLIDEQPNAAEGQRDILNEAEEDLEALDPGAPEGGAAAEDLSGQTETLGETESPSAPQEAENGENAEPAEPPSDPELPQTVDPVERDGHQLSATDTPEPAVNAAAGEAPGGATAPDAAQETENTAELDAAAAAKAERARMARLRQYFRSVLDGLIVEYATGDRGLEIREVAGGFRLATKPEYHDAVRGFVRSLKPPLKLSLQALETLAVIAYKQPITAPEISEIRGVDSGGVLGSLMARKLISTAGRKQVIGRPILYKTTKEFLLKFGLKDTNELPSIEEFERMAGQMAEQEEIPMPDAADPRPDVDPELEETAEKLEPERNFHSPQADGDSAPADNLESAPEDKASVDGRISSLPPNYDAAELDDNPSAQDAEIQSEQGS